MREASTYCILKGCVIQSAEATLVTADVAGVGRDGPSRRATDLVDLRSDEGVNERRLEVQAAS